MVARSIRGVNRPDADDGLDILSKIGGFEIGGIAGVILAACSNRVPVVVDGYISTAAALLASVFHPNVKDFLFSGQPVRCGRASGDVTRPLASNP